MVYTGDGFHPKSGFKKVWWTQEMVLTRPSKCPKFYTTMISGEKDLRQKESKFSQKLNCYK